MSLTQRLQRRAESRNMGTLSSYGTQSIVAPNAIPPPGFGGSTAAGMLVNETTSLTIDVVQTALHYLTSGIIKRGNLCAYTSTIGPGGLEQRQWQESPNPFLSDSFAFEGPASNSQSRGYAQMVVSLALFGESWLYQLTSDRVGNATAVQILHPLMLAIKEKNGETVYEYGSGMAKVELEPAQLYHVERISLPGHARALSNIRESSVTYGIALAAAQYTSLWFSQGAQVPYLITADGEIASDMADRISQKFRVDHSGIRQAHIPVVTGSNVKLTPTGTNADGAQMLQTLEYVRTCIGSMFGIPSHLLGGIGDKGNVWGANHEEQMQSMEDFTYAAYVTPIQEAFSDLLPGGLKAAWPLTLIQPNLLNLATSVQFISQSNSMTPNEVRAMYWGLPPLPDGDSLMTPLASNTAPEQTGAAASEEQSEDKQGSNSGSDGDGNQ